MAELTSEPKVCTDLQSTWDDLTCPATATGHQSEITVPLGRGCASLLKSPLSAALTLELLLPAHPGKLHCPVHKE